MMIPFNTENLLSKANGFSENQLPTRQNACPLAGIGPKKYAIRLQFQ